MNYFSIFWMLIYICIILYNIYIYIYHMACTSYIHTCAATRRKKQPDVEHRTRHSQKKAKLGTGG